MFVEPNAYALSQKLDSIKKIQEHYLDKERRKEEGQDDSSIWATNELRIFCINFVCLLTRSVLVYI